MTCSRKAWRRATFGTQVPSRTCGRRLNSCDPTAWLVTFTKQRCSCYLLFCGHVRAMCVLLPAPRGTARQHQQKSPTWDSSVLAHPCDRRKSVMRGRGCLVLLSPASNRNHLPLAPCDSVCGAEALRRRWKVAHCSCSPKRLRFAQREEARPSSGGADPTTRKRRVLQRANGQSCMDCRSQHDSLSWLQTTLRRAQAQHVFVKDRVMFLFRDRGNALTSSGERSQLREKLWSDK